VASLIEAMVGVEDLCRALAAREAEVESRERAVAAREAQVEAVAGELMIRVERSSPYLLRESELKAAIGELTKRLLELHKQVADVESILADKQAQLRSIEDQISAGRQRMVDVQSHVLRALEERDALLRNLAFIEASIEIAQRRQGELTDIVRGLRQEAAALDAARR